MSEPEWIAPTGRFRRPVPTWVAPAIGALICAAPAWLMADLLRDHLVKGDDFVYLARSRTWPRVISNLWAPHNAHVVPLFRLWTFALMAMAGRLANLPRVLGSASYGMLVLVMLAGGRFVAREARDPALGLAAMAALGITTVVAPVVTWYSAGQALWAGLGILAMLLALQGWRDSSGLGVTWLALAALAAASAAAFWSGGHVAGPVGATYLWTEGRPRGRKAAAVPLLATAATLGALFLLGGRELRASARPHERAIAEAAHPFRGLLHTSQAIPETLILGNLGLDAAIDVTQGVVFCLALAGLWVWSRGPGIPRPNSLEAAGAALVVLSYLLVYTFRGYLPFASLRSIGWYHAIPHVGAVLFAAGWWSALFRRGSPSGRPLTRGGALAILGFAAFLLLIQAPRARRMFLAGAEPLTASERAMFPIPELQRLRAVYLATERAARQHRFLARLDRAERLGIRYGISREAIRHALGRIDGPGLPEKLPDFDATDLLDLPRTGTTADPTRVRALLEEWLITEPVPRPPWLDPREPWPQPPAP